MVSPEENLRRICEDQSKALLQDLEEYTGEQDQAMIISISAKTLNEHLKKLFELMSPGEKTILISIITHHAWVTPKPEKYTDLIELVSELLIFLPKHEP